MVYNALNHTITRDNGEPFAALDPSVTTEEAFELADFATNSATTRRDFNERVAELRSSFNTTLRERVARIDDLERELADLREENAELQLQVDNLSAGIAV